MGETKLSSRLILTIFGLLLFVRGVGAAPSADPAKAKFIEPQILFTKGPAQVIGSSDKKVPAKKNLALREKVTLETGKNGWILVALTKNEKLFVGPDSRVGLPVISWDDGSVERIELEKGHLRLMNMTSQGRQVVTPLTRDSYSEGDLVFVLDMQKPALTVKVLDGHAVFRGRENEESIDVKEGEQATFTGVFENGELAEDVLLAGRRVVRGKMSEKSKVSEGDREFWVKAMTDVEQQDHRAAIAAKKEILRRGAICTKPQGRFNECAWVCENNPKKEKVRCRVDLPKVQCVRRRCDADGHWSDALVLTAQQSSCGVKPLVHACDY